MPQMNPTWWLTLFLFFTMIFLLINSLIYFSKNIKPLNKSLTKTLMPMNNWKW